MLESKNKSARHPAKILSFYPMCFSFRFNKNYESYMHITGFLMPSLHWNSLKTNFLDDVYFFDSTHTVCLKVFKDGARQKKLGFRPHSNNRRPTKFVLTFLCFSFLYVFKKLLKRIELLRCFTSVFEMNEFVYLNG